MITSQPEKYLGVNFFHHDLKLHGVRVSMSPEQLWEFYKEKRDEFSLILVPVEVEKFLDEVKTPAEPALTSILDVFFDKNAKTPYDPTSPRPGFQKPAQVKVSWITADPESPKYRDPARVRALLEIHPLYSPIMPPLVNAVNFMLGTQAEKRAYFSLFLQDYRRKVDYERDPLTSNCYLDVIAASQGLESPLAFASFVASMARPGSVVSAPDNASFGYPLIVLRWP